ncbi:MAG: SdrD B-like domain-containing protein [Anaerolineae bacterium]
MKKQYLVWKLWIILALIAGVIGPADWAAARAYQEDIHQSIPRTFPSLSVDAMAPLEPPPDAPAEVADDEGEMDPDALQKSNWFAQAVAYIEAAEYHVSPHNDTWAAPNRAQNLRCTFTPNGVRMTPRVQHQAMPGSPAEGKVTLNPFAQPGIDAWAWTLQLTGVGRVGHVASVQENPRMTADENRVTYHHRIAKTGSQLAFTEWYVNEPRGLKHGVTFNTQPAPSHSTPLVLEFTVGGDLAPVLRPNNTIDLTTGEGRPVLRYSELHVYDATGRSLPATLDVRSTPSEMRNTEHIQHRASNTLRLTINDTDAVYPLTVDPLLSSPWATDPADTSNAQLGYDISSIGDLNGDGYDDLAVSAPGYNSDQGQLWIYHGSADGPANALNIDPDWETEPTGQDDAHFGMAVAGAGDVNNDGYDDVLIGTPDFDAGESGEGRVYLYLGSVTGLETTPAWSGDPTDQIDAGFGHAVTGVGDVDGDGYDDWVVGAPRYANEGMVYLYRGAANLAGLTASWAVSPTGQTDALFGWSVASPGDVNGDGRPDIAVGAPYFDAEESNEGRAYLFLSTAGSVPGSTAAWTADPVDQADAHFGEALASAGDVNCDGKADLIAGAPGFDNENTDEGAVYVYFGAGGSLSTTPDWSADPTDQDDAHFGTTVSPIATGACDGIVAGAPDYDDPGVSWSDGEGIVYAFPVYTTTLNSARYCTSMGGTSLSHWGRALAPAGDVDNDGTDELLVSLDRYDVMYAISTAGASEAVNLVTYTGYPWCQFSSGEGLQPIDVQDLSAVGYAAAGAGDVNGDGYADVILGAPYHDGSSTSNEGHAYVYYGSPHGLIPTYSVTTDGMGNIIARTITEDRTVVTGTVGDRFGAAVAPAGDVNADGYDDLLIGAPGADGEADDEGRAYLYYGAPSGLTWMPVWQADPTDAEAAQFGKAVGGAGDVNGDGYDDLIIGAPTLTTTVAAEGRAYVYHGATAGPGSNPAWTLDPVDEAAAHFGAAVGAAGDVDDDGYADVIVGAPGANDGVTDQGAAYVYRGSSTGLSSTAWWNGTGGRANAHYGFAVSSAGNVNGDAYADWIVGAPDDDTIATGQGRADVYLGGASPPVTVSWTSRPTGTQTNLHYGITVGAAGDVGNDGFDDVIVGGPGYVGYTHEGADIAEGRAYVYHGSGSGLATAPSWATDPTNQDGAEFGFATAGGRDINGDGYADVLVGAPGYYRNSTHGHEGRAYVYFGTERGLEPDTEPDWRADPSTVTDERNGYAVNTAGDVNGDGYDDVTVAAYCATGSSGLCGHVYVYHGSATGVSAPDSPDWDTANPGTNSQFFARSVSTAGDVNNDGYDDLLVGNPDYIHTPSNIYTGAVHLYLGSAMGLSGTVTITEPASTNIAQSWFGQAVAAAGDVDNDGYDDIVVGAPYASPAGNGEGMAFVYYGDANGIHAQYSPMDATDQYGAEFGAAVSGAGDVNGDGYDDVIVGAPWQDGWDTDKGTLYVYHGSSSGVGLTSDWADSPEASQSWYHVGSSVSAAGDLNADGYDDIIAGGREVVLAYYGSAAGLDNWNGPDWVMTNEHLQLDAENADWPVAGAGDVNGDGYADVIVGIPFYDGQNADEGAVVIYHSTTCGGLGSPTAPGWIASPTENDYTYFGSAVAPAGDVNGDGVDDVIAGAPEYDTDVGRAYLFHGVQAPSQSNLAVGKWAAPNPVARGETLTYTVVVSNVCATADATHVVLTDTLPSGVNLHTATTTQGSCTPGAGEVGCTLGTLTNGAVATVTLVVTPTAAGTITNTATVTADQEDISLLDNTAQAATDVFVDPCETILLEPFENSSTPTGWSVVDNQGNGQVWRFDNPGGRWNQTGGDGNFAIVDSDFYGESGTQDTELRTPLLDFSAAAYGYLDFDTDFWRSASEIADVDISDDGGSTWTNVWRKNSNYRGPAHESVDLTALAGQSAAQIRFRYYNASYAWYWQVDNVEIRRCVSPYGVTIAPPAAVQVGPRGGAVTYTLQVTNTGTAPDTYTVTVGGNTWPTQAPASIGPLAAGAGSAMTVTVSIPAGATPGSSDTAVITATSTADEMGSTCDTATLTTTANHPPVALADTYVVTKNTTLTVTAPGLLTNDSDADGDALSVLLQSNVSHGSLSIGTDGAFSYTPNAGYLGEDAFTYKASDGDALSDLVTATLIITNHAPVALADTYVVTKGTTLNVTAPGLLTNDSDADGDPLTALLQSNVSHGALSIGTDGAFSYTPNAGYLGTDAFTYKASDGYESSAPVTVTLNVISPYGAIGDRVWRDVDMDGFQDTGESGVSNVQVRLFTAAGVLSETTNTNASGIYSFTELTPGDYYLQFVLPAGYRFSPQDQGLFDTADSDADPATGKTITTTLSVNEYDATWDAGIYRLATVGDRLWNDINYNGRQDAGESGVAGITVTLSLSGTTAPYAHTVTNASGHYSFTVTPGAYALHFARPSGTIFTRPDLSDEATDSDVGAGGNTPPFTLGEGETNPDWDAGVVQTASVGDFVWHDIDEDGIQDNEEVGQPGVTVEIYNRDGIAGTTTTDSDGKYRFTNLTPDNYYVKVVPPPGWHFGIQDNPVAADDEDSDVDPLTGETAYFTLNPGDNDDTIDAGIYPEASTVGDRVWYDANTNGLQDIGESGYPSATVSLYMAGASAPLAATTTDANGLYRFQNVLPGRYFLEFPLPYGHLLAPQNVGSDDTRDSDADRTTGRTAPFTLTAGITETLWDAGLYRYAEQSVVNPGGDSSLVYTDTQGNPTAVHVPGNAITRTTTFFYTPFSASWAGTRAQQRLQATVSFANHAFRLDAKQDSHVLTVLTFAGPVTVTITYSESDIEDVKEEAQLLLYYWDRESSAWIDATLTCGAQSSQTRDAHANLLRAEICAPGRYGLFGPAREGSEIYLPLVMRGR